MKKQEIRKIAFASMIIAIILILTFTLTAYLPFFGGAVFISIVHIPVIIGAIILGPRYGAILGLFFGLSSLYIASITLGGNAPFTNPVLSVLPRIAFGFATPLMYSYFTKKIRSKVFATVVSTTIMWLLHAVVVISTLYFVAVNGWYFTASENPWTSSDHFLTLFISVFSVNTLFETAVTLLITTPIILRLNYMIEDEKNVDKTFD